MEDMEVLETRVRQLDHPDTSGAVFVCCTNDEVGKRNKVKLQLIESEKIKRLAWRKNSLY